MRYMKYICNQCAKVFQADDITIHYTTSHNGLEIVAICSSCLDDYLGKSKVNADTKSEEDERGKMVRKW